MALTPKGLHSSVPCTWILPIEQQARFDNQKLLVCPQTAGELFKLQARELDSQWRAQMRTQRLSQKTHINAVHYISGNGALTDIFQKSSLGGSDFNPS